MRKTQAVFAVVVAAIAGSQQAASAQEPQSASAPGHLAAVSAGQPIEIGAGVGAVAYRLGTGTVSGGHVGVTIPVRDGLSIDGFAAIGRQADGTVGLYTIQMKHRISAASRPGIETFITYGLTGFFEDRREAGYRYSESYLTPPFLVALGGGVQRTLAPRLAMRFEAQLMSFFVYPVGLRAAVGVSIPLGTIYRSSQSRGRSERTR